MKFYLKQIFLDITEIPTKCISSNRTVQVKAHIQYIDFEGRSDGESLIKILSQLRPRRVIVVRGISESTATIQNHCREQVGARVFAPNRGEVIDATTETHIYQVNFFSKMYSLSRTIIVSTIISWCHLLITDLFLDQSSSCIVMS